MPINYLNLLIEILNYAIKNSLLTFTSSHFMFLKAHYHGSTLHVYSEKRYHDTRNETTVFMHAEWFNLVLEPNKTKTK